MRLSLRPIASVLAVLSTAAVCTTATATASAATASAIRINSGGGAVIDGSGRAWLADTHVTGGKVSSVTSVTSPNPQVDRTYRFGAVRYSIPVADVDYTLRLHLVEPWFHTVGSRVFDVAVEGRTVVDDKDLLASGSRLTSQVVQVPVRTSDGRLDLAFTNVVNNAIVSGIELVPTSAPAVPPPPTPTSPSGLAMPQGDQPGYVQTFTDDFSGTTLSSTKWGKYAGQPGSDPGSQWAPSHVVVGGDVVSLLTYRDPAYLNKWTSGGINNARSGARHYGKYEVRMRMDAAKGINGVGLLWPTNGTWPPEIDFVEDRDGDRRDFTATLHYKLDGVHKMLHGGTRTLDMTRWHTYGVEWGPGKVTYTVDGVPWKTQSSTYVPSIGMAFAVQSNAVTRGTVQPDSTTPARSKVEIDWVVGYRLA